MTRAEQLRFCKVCTKHKFDLQQGIICSLTGKQADFEDSCDWFEEDSKSADSNDLSEFETSNRLFDASRGKRFANYIIDLIGFVIFSFIVGIVLGVLLVALFPENTGWLETENSIMEYLFGAIVGIIYYGLQEHLTGRTIAKYITKTKVVMEDGSKPELKAILIRSASRFIPFEAFSFLFGEPSGLHDKISKTRVVDVN